MTDRAWQLLSKAAGRITVAIADYDEGRCDLDRTVSRLIRAVILYGKRPDSIVIEVRGHYLPGDEPQDPEPEENPITRYWLDHYVSKDLDLCVLCGNTGKIDTRQSAISNAGQLPGRVDYCICPNGQEMRRLAR